MEKEIIMSNIEGLANAAFQLGVNCDTKDKYYFEQREKRQKKKVFALIENLLNAGETIDNLLEAINHLNDLLKIRNDEISKLRGI